MKTTTQVKARVLADHGLLSGMKGQELVGYEIHMGQTDANENMSAFNVFETPQGTVDYLDGTLNTDGTVLGTYLHGLFHNSGFRRSLLNSLRRKRGLPEQSAETLVNKEQQYDRLAELVRQHLDMTAIAKIVGLGARNNGT